MMEQTKKRIVSFVRTIAGRCANCMRRTDENCRNCLSAWANSILVDIEADEEGASNRVDYSLVYRIKRIIFILSKAKRPLMSEEIKLNGICSKQLKMWTLNKLIRKNVIGRKLVSRSTNGKMVFKYFLKAK